MPTLIWTVALLLPLASLAAFAAAAARERGFRPLKGFAERVGRLPLGTRLAAALLACALWAYGGAKPGRARSAPPPAAPADTARRLTDEDFARGFVLARVGTGERFDFSPPPGATVVDDWRAFGAAEDWIYLAFTNRAPTAGADEVARLRVFSFGKVDSLVRDGEGNAAAGTWFAPFMASLGIVPQANWSRLDASVRPSQVWHATTPEGSLSVTWQNALLGRDAGRPVSFQAELFPDGRFVYRYDLSRRGEGGVPVTVGAALGGGAWTTNALPTNVTSMAFYPLTEEDRDNPDADGDGLPTDDELFLHGTDPHNADTDCDGLTDYEEQLIHGTDPLNPRSVRGDLCDGIAVKLDGLDPFASPEGSTNTALEHVFYSGTTNGAFAFPRSSDKVAVLRVSASGFGTGDLIVGDTVVPLVAPPRMRSAPPPAHPPLLVPLARGRTHPLHLRTGDGLLDVSLDSEDFAFGALPTRASPGRINFPLVRATEPCIHDFNARRKGVSLPAGRDARLLACTWRGGDGVMAENAPPRAATLTGSFPARETRGVTYTLSHPDYLFGRTSYGQTVRFCPKPPDPDPEESDPPWCSAGEGDASDGSDDDHDEHWCCHWGACSRWCICECTCGGVPDEPLPGEEGLDEACPGHSTPYADCAPLHEDDYTNAVQRVPRLGGVLYIREPPSCERIRLDVPAEHRNCCPCPDHWTNHVGVAYKSRRLRLVDADGRDFGRTETSCDVLLSGVSPSAAVGDAALAFARNGEVYRQYAKTVLGVAIRGGPGVDLAACNALSHDFGYPMTVCTNPWHAPSMTLATNVKLPNGHIHLELLNATGQFTVWYFHYNSGTYRKLLDSSSTSVKDLSLPYWRKQVARASSGNSPEVPVYITSSSPGSVRLLFRYWTVIDGKFVQDEACQKITSINPALLPDMNYDGNVDDADVALFLAGRKFRFWQNEDTIKGSYRGQISGNDLNAADSVVNGAYDLVNFFPMAVNFAPLLNAWGSQVTYHIEPEWQTDDSFNFCWANIGKQGYRRMQSETVTDICGIALENASVANLPAVGYTIPYSVLNAVSGNSGMIVSEAKASHVSMKFTVKHGGNVIFSYLAPLSISRVKDMYRWLNIRHVAGDSSGERSATSTPWNRPDSECDDRHFVFVHGYNVNASQARQWAHSIFKRLWWSGSRSRFTAVDWYGDDSQLANYMSPNYYINVEHALVTAPALSSQCAGLQGDKTFIAHSLGNMVVSSAAKEHGLSYAKYYMVDAAVAMECYNPGMISYNMIEHGWRDVPERLWVSNWHQLFTSSDGRCDLRWNLRFQNLPNIVNCYSPSEDVLANASMNGWGGAWSMQELFKGTAALHAIPGNCEGGWGYNGGHTNWLGLLPDEVKTNTYTNAQLTLSPIFRPFDDGSLHTTNVATLTLAQKAKVLGDGIPALSFAAGANPFVNGQGIINVNMPKFARDWPRSLGTWKHSDINDVAYRYLSAFYDLIVNGLEEVNE